MQLRDRLAGLATALVLGATILGLTAEPAAAEKNKTQKDQGKDCGMEGHLMKPPQEEDYVFVPPGEWVDVSEGPNRTATYECQKDGTWKQIARTKPRVPVRVPSGTFTQAP